MNVLQEDKLSQWRLILERVMVELGDLGKQGPELVDYLEQYTNIVVRHLPKIKGTNFYLNSGNHLQQIYNQNLDELKKQLDDDHVYLFQEIIKYIILNIKPVYLQSGIDMEVGLKGLALKDTPAMSFDNFFNKTSFDHYFIPILVGDQIYGVWHVWMQPLEVLESKLWEHAFSQISTVIQLYLKNRKVEEITKELIRLKGYSAFLEQFSGIFDLKKVSLKIVDYLKNITNSDRVLLFLADNYKEVIDNNLKAYNIDFNYRLFEIAGIHLPDIQSQEGRSIQSMSLTLLKKMIEELSQKDEIDFQDSPSSSTKNKKTSKIRIKSVPKDRKLIPSQWIYRQMEDNNFGEYFSLAPMNWATVMPILDGNFQVCGYIVIEGKELPSKAPQVLLQYADLPYVLGSMLEKILFWNDRKTLKLARKVELIKDKYLNTSKKEKIFWTLGPLFLLIFVFLFPLKFYINADGSIRPRFVQQMTAETNARIIQIHANEGNIVRKDQVLLELDTELLKLSINQYESEYLKSLAEVDRYFSQRDELNMVLAQLNAEKTNAQLEYLRYQLDHSIVKAPFDGVIIGPKNLRDRHGSFAQVGETLIEFAKLDAWDVKIKLKEYDLLLLSDKLKKGDEVYGDFKLQADPSKVYPLILNEQTQLMHGLEVDVLKGTYFFNSVIPFLNSNIDMNHIKPGYSGKVSFYIGYRPLIYVMLRQAILYVKVNWL